MSRRHEHAHEGETKKPGDLGTAGLALFDQQPIAEAAPVRRVAVRAHLRTVAGEPEPSGAERRDAALAKHGQHPAVQQARAYLRRELATLYRHRLDVWRRRVWMDAAEAAVNAPFVTADDADRILREWAACPRAIYELPSQNWRGSIFAGAGWVKTGRYVQAERDHMHRTGLPCWALREDAQEGVA